VIERVVPVRAETPPLASASPAKNRKWGADEGLR
jgi:hypothetical protein